MEASEKPQLPLDADARRGQASVRLVDDRIVIERLQIADEGTARVVRERAEAGEEPARTVRRAIEIGARVLDREDTAAEVDYVEREFEQVTRRAPREPSQEKNREMPPARGDRAGASSATTRRRAPSASALDCPHRGLAEQIASTFGEDREGAVQAQIKRMLERARRGVHAPAWPRTTRATRSSRC